MELKLIIASFMLSVAALWCSQYAPVWWVLPIHLLAGGIGFVSLFGDKSRWKWNVAKTGTLTACLLFGLATLAVAAWVKKDSNANTA